jgi:hypothetical protein
MGRARQGRPGVRFSEMFKFTGLIMAGGRGQRWLNGMHRSGAASASGPLGAGGPGPEDSLPTKLY